MTDYRAVVRHVRYWKGEIHRWSTSYSFTGTGATPDAAACTLLKNGDSAMCYQLSGGFLGGIYEVSIYLASGGTPVATQTYFDYLTPGSWIPYTSTGWGSSTGAVEKNAEVALLVTFNGGLGRTGKPVTFRKWYHAVPVSSTTPPAQDIASGVITTLTAAALAVRTCLNPGYGLVMGNSGRLGTDVAVEAYYSNHQMPKGRRRLVGATGKASSYKGPTIVLPVEPD